MAARRKESVKCEKKENGDIMKDEQRLRGLSRKTLKNEQSGYFSGDEKI